MQWPGICNSADFDQACNDYDNADIVKIDRLQQGPEYKKLYVSKLDRSIKTAQALFPNDAYEIINVEEVPLKSFKDSSHKYPLWLWNIIGRIQWYRNNNRQDEVRSETIKRAQVVIKELANKNEDCVIVTHGFFMMTFIRCLKKQKFSVHNKSKISFSNLQIVTAEKVLDWTGF